MLTAKAKISQDFSIQITLVTESNNPDLYHL